MSLKTNYSNEIAYTVKAYKIFKEKCKTLEKIINKMIRETPSHEYINGKILCDYIPDNGLSFIIKIEGDIQYVVNCGAFFNLFKKGYENVTINKIKELNY